MSEHSKLSADEVLRLFLETPIETGYAHFLDLLIKRAIPVIEKCLRTKFQESANNGFRLSEEDFKDLSNESCLRLMEKLSALRDFSDTEPIRDFEKYVAVIAFNTLNEFLSFGKPNWKSLKYKVRYALGKADDFESWNEKDVIYFCLIKNRRKKRQVLIEDLIILVREEFVNFRNAALPDLLYEIFEKAGSAIRLNESVAIVARLWAIEDLPDTSFEDFRENIITSRHLRQNDFEMRVELKQIWQEICELPPNQRIALLYNLRDEHGREMLLMFFNTKIASLHEIAGAMNLNFKDCAVILPQLPLTDKIIAEKMKLTAKQIANLRKVARENLRRRIQGIPKRNSRFNELKSGDETDGENLNIQDSSSLVKKYG